RCPLSIMDIIDSRGSPSEQSQRTDTRRIDPAKLQTRRKHLVLDVGRRHLLACSSPKTETMRVSREALYQALYIQTR
ncbi:hypothetical protein, partial [uncultured Jannaschia sp.]|uniref:hypothetical protein n=1 Tax=uncultured Jannaschia sp. TaxID=293347 RepID=UPI0026054D15